MKLAPILALVALLLPAGLAVRETRQEEVEPCDLAKVEDGFWCLRCRRARHAAELDKDGRCAACGLVPEKTKLCFKSWVPKCGMHEMAPHEKPCCTSPTCCRVENLGAPVDYRCAGCGSTAATEARILHRKGPHRTEIQPSCSRSGRFPHGGKLPVKKKKDEDEPKEGEKEK
jgi:DNA-directed RNA polymerase subunit RPC12/RpoP